ncbi:unnamed protein product [Rhizoctonia solani]|uniref:BTB domain-containing protein n=1 Tax=Rhizoctonia solani TaxID=456999 RepID=A0A8H3AL91_9AGAM|nr:unnamed protein product [Rhizoctonia solani]
MPATRSSSTTRTPKPKQKLQITLPSRRSARKSSPLPSSRVSKPVNTIGSGYLTLRSSNNIKISVRSEVLRSYLPRLYEDYRANPESEIKLPYSSHALLLIVGFLSRGFFQPANETAPFDYLGDCFDAAKAYGLSSLTTWLRSELSHPRSAYYMEHSPIQAYSICSTHNFKEEKELAFQRCIGTIDFSSPSSITLVSAKCHNSTIALELISRLSRRNTIILELFGTLHMYPMDLRSYIWRDQNDPDITKPRHLTCSSCRDDTIFQAPSWMVLWAHFAKKQLLKKPGAECGQVFKVEFMSKQRDGTDFFGDKASEEDEREDEMHACRSCLKKILIDNPARWEDWARDIKHLLKKELGADF